MHASFRDSDLQIKFTGIGYTFPCKQQVFDSKWSSRSLATSISTSASVSAENHLNKQRRVGKLGKKLRRRRSRLRLRRRSRIPLTEKKHASMSSSEYTQLSGRSTLSKGSDLKSALPVRKSRLVLASVIFPLCQQCQFLDLSYVSFWITGACKLHLNIFSRFCWLRWWPEAAKGRVFEKQWSHSAEKTQGLPRPRSGFQSPSKMLPSSTISPFLLSGRSSSSI